VGGAAVRFWELKQKEVININTCRRMGYVGDLEFDPVTGCITAIIIPGPACLWGFLGREREFVIPFCDICQLGGDIILVNYRENRDDCK
jgi:YlmC/YmxH family sporulation protein